MKFHQIASLEVADHFRMVTRVWSSFSFSLMVLAGGACGKQPPANPRITSVSESRQSNRKDKEDFVQIAQPYQADEKRIIGIATRAVLEKEKGVRKPGFNFGQDVSYILFRDKGEWVVDATFVSWRDEHGKPITADGDFAMIRIDSSGKVLSYNRGL